jgi:hypothetical protein
MKDNDTSQIKNYPLIYGDWLLKLGVATLKTGDPTTVLHGVLKELHGS